MNLTLNKINELPMYTWSWLNVNHYTLKENIPTIDSFNTTNINWNGNDKNILQIDANDSNYDYIYNFKTGIGREHVDFVKEYYNSEFAIRIPEGMQLKNPIFITYDLDDAAPSLVDINKIIADENSKVTIVILYKSTNHQRVFHSGLTYIHAKKNSEVHLVTIQLLNDQATHLSDIGTLLADDAHINITQCELGANKAIWGSTSDLRGVRSAQDVKAIYFADQDNEVDMNYIANHFGKLTNSNMVLKGALLDRGKKLFRGTIDFKRGASGAIGKEEEFNLLFSPTIKNITTPLILCGEDNVEGNHGANSGKIPEEQLFYMMSRGIDENTAKKLMIEASFMPAILTIPDGALREDVLDFVKERLNNVQSI